MPPKEDKINYKIAYSNLKVKKISKKGVNYFIPGNHDWYNGIKGLERQEEIVTDYFDDKESFSPRLPY
jgi:hypothetical protein